MKNKKINKKKFIIACLICITFILVVVFSIIKAKPIIKLKSNFKSEKVNLQFKDRTTDLANYQYKNYLTIGWLQVQGTNIDYPILSSNAANDEDVTKNYGWRSPYYQSNENREVLLGHNIINVSSIPIRDMSVLNNFEGLMAFTYDDFAKKNLYISYTKNNETSIYKIYAVGFYVYESTSDTGYTDKEEITSYINKTRKNSIYDYDVDVTAEDELLTLKTCTRYFGIEGKRAFTIDARKIRENEDTITYEVKTNNNYQELSKGVSNENS